MALVTERGVALCVSQRRKKQLPLNLVHGTTSQNATIHTAMPDPGFSQQLFVFETLSSVLQTSTQENTSESCIETFLQEMTQWQKG